MQHSKHLSVTAVKDISIVSTTNKIKIAIVFLASMGRFWDFFLRLAANSAMGMLTHCHLISRLILKYSKNLHLSRATKAKEKIPLFFSKFWIKQQIVFMCESDVALCWVTQNPRKLCSSDSQQIQAEAAYRFLTLEFLQIAGDLGLLYPKEEVWAHCWPTFICAETKDTGRIQFQSSSLCGIWPIDFQCRISHIQIFQGHLENL